MGVSISGSQAEAALAAIQALAAEISATGKRNPVFS